MTNPPCERARGRAFEAPFLLKKETVHGKKNIMGMGEKFAPGAL